MLETIFRRRHHIRRLRANPLGMILDQYVGYLLGRGHTINVVPQYVRAAEPFGHWLGTRHVVVSADHLTGSSAPQGWDCALRCGRPKLLRHFGPKRATR